MTSKPAAIDCDVHPAPPGLQALLPYLDDYWRNSVVERGIPSLETNSYPPRAPLSARPQARGEKGNPQATLAQLTEQVFGRWQADRGVQLPLRRRASVQRGHGGRISACAQ